MKLNDYLHTRFREDSEGTPGFSPEQLMGGERCYLLGPQTWTRNTIARLGLLGGGIICFRHFKFEILLDI